MAEPLVRRHAVAQETLLGLALPLGLIADLHENAGTFILILAGLHALMAIWHQFVLRDVSSA